MKTLSFFRLLGSGQFLRLWTTQIVIQIAINMTNYTVLLLLADRTHNTLIQAQFYAAITIPAVLFGFVAGPIVEVTSRKILLVLSTSAFLLLFFLYTLGGTNIFFLFVIAFLVSSLARFFVPATAATIPLIVKSELLEEANSLFLFTLLGSVVVGYMLSSPILQIFGGLGSRGEQAPFLLGCILAVFGMLLSLSMKPIPKETVVTPSGTLMKKSFFLFLETLSKVKSERLLIGALALLTFVELNIGIVTVVLLEYVRRYLLLPVTMVTYVLIFPFILGLFLGTIFLRPFEKRFGRTGSLLGACLFIGVLFLLFGFLPSLFASASFIGLLRFISFVSSLLVGAAIVLISVHARTILQTHAPITMQGRIFSFLDILIALVTPIPVLFLGYFANQVSLLSSLVVYGTVVIMAVLLTQRGPERPHF